MNTSRAHHVRGRGEGGWGWDWGRNSGNEVLAESEAVVSQWLARGPLMQAQQHTSEVLFRALCDVEGKL